MSNMPLPSCRIISSLCGQRPVIWANKHIRFGSALGILEKIEPEEVVAIHFCFVLLEHVALYVSKLRRFPKLTTLSFAHTHFTHLAQINYFDTLRSTIHHVIVYDQQNPIVYLEDFKPYFLYRLPQLEWKTLNEQPVTPKEREEAEKRFGKMFFLQRSDHARRTSGAGESGH